MTMKNITAILMTVFVSLSLTACKVESNSSTRAEGAKEQESVMERAKSAVPTYVPSNFLTREAVQKWMERMDVPDKTFYIYLMGNNGNHIGYYVGQTRPISSCTLMTPPDKLHYWSSSAGKATAVTDAPSLDGVYGKGGCDSFFFFDASTDAYIEINGLNFFVADQPLNIDVEPIQVATQ